MPSPKHKVDCVGASWKSTLRALPVYQFFQLLLTVETTATKTITKPIASTNAIPTTAIITEPTKTTTIQKSNNISWMFVKPNTAKWVFKGRWINGKQSRNSQIIAITKRIAQTRRNNNITNNRQSDKQTNKQANKETLAFNDKWIKNKQLDTLLDAAIAGKRAKVRGPHQVCKERARQRFVPPYRCQEFRASSKTVMLDLLNSTKTESNRPMLTKMA